MNFNSGAPSDVSMLRILNFFFIRSDFLPLFSIIHAGKPRLDDWKGIEDVRGRESVYLKKKKKRKFFSGCL